MTGGPPGPGGADAAWPEAAGLLHGPDADTAMAAGRAYPLAGGPIAFTTLRSHGQDQPIGVAPAVLVRSPPPWAGFDGPAIMGILNVTPDSFSDGGTHADPGVAIAAGLAMIGLADIVDVGGESTRPGATPMTPDDEQARVLPVVRALATAGACVSIDTRNAATMAAALDAGARIVNDVSALTHDPAAAALVAARGCPVVLMHMRGTPATMQSLADYTDLAQEVTQELAARLAVALAAGIAPAQIALDPGFGFAKTAQHNRALLQRLPVLLNLGHRIVAGLSRKATVGALADEPVAARRDPGSIAAALAALDRGATILRVHDVAATRQALRVWLGLRHSG